MQQVLQSCLLMLVFKSYMSFLNTNRNDCVLILFFLIVILLSLIKEEKETNT